MRFRLRTLFVALGIACLALGVAVERGHRQRRAVEAIIARGGRVEYQPGDFWPQSWQTWFGKDIFRPVSQVFWAGAPINDEDLGQLSTLPQLETLSLASTPITDAGLKHLEGLRRAQLIDLRFTQVTDEAAVRLRRTLPHAKILLHSDVD